MKFWFRLSTRTRLGIIAFALMTCAVAALLSWYQAPDSFSYRSSGSLIRFAPLIFLLWLAWADLKAIVWWHWLVMLVTIVICGIKPAFWWVGMPVLAYILFAGKKR